MRAAVVALAVLACSPGPSAQSGQPASGAPQSFGSPSRTAGPPPSVTLTCSDAIGSDPPASDYTVVLGVVALPTSEASGFALQTAPSGERDPAARLFAKKG